MGKDLDQHDQAMRKAGYNSKQISDYWYEIMMDPQFCDRQYRLIEMFVRKGFPVAFMVAEEITVVNRATGKYSGISLGMLRKKSQQTLLDMKYWDEKRSARDSKGQTSSMLMYYDSSHEGLRSGSKSAG
jgi:hypothetical protein